MQNEKAGDSDATTELHISQQKTIAHDDNAALAMAATDEAWPAISESADNVQNSAGYKTGSVSSESPIEKAGDKNNGKSGAKFRQGNAIN